MSDAPAWDVQRAESLDGATVLVGITFVSPEGDEQSQFYGTVMDVSPVDGITLRLEGQRSGETYTLPPDLDAFEPAAPGEYRLRSTGEVLIDPDFTTSWTINAPAN